MKILKIIYFSLILLICSCDDESPACVECNSFDISHNVIDILGNTMTVEVTWDFTENCSFERIRLLSNPLLLQTYVDSTEPQGSTVFQATNFIGRYEAFLTTCPCNKSIEFSIDIEPIINYQSSVSTINFQECYIPN